MIFGISLTRILNSAIYSEIPVPKNISISKPSFRNDALAKFMAKAAMPENIKTKKLCTNPEDPKAAVKGKRH